MLLLVEISFRNCILLCVTTVIASCRNTLLMQNLISAYIIFWVVETIRSIFFDFLARRSSFFVQWKCIFQGMLHSGQWKLIFWLVQTRYINIFCIFFPETFVSESFFPSSVNVVLNESFISDIGNGFPVQWKPS